MLSGTDTLKVRTTQPLFLRSSPPEIQVLRCENLLLTQPQGQGRVAERMKPIFKKAPRLAKAHLGILVSNLG